MDMNMLVEHPASQAIMNGLGVFFAECEKYSWIGSATNFVHIPVVDNQLIPIAEATGMQLTVIKYTLGLFLVYPLAGLLRKLPSTQTKHIMSFVGGLVLMQWIYGADWIHSFITSFVTYLLCLVVPKKYVHIVVFMWAMSYMTLSHIYRMYVSYLSGIFDFTGTQMVLTMKLTSFGYNLYDGTADFKRVFAIYDPVAQKKLSRVYGDRKKFAIEELPSLLEFFGYIYCFTCILAGPAFEYNDYIRSINETVFATPKNVTEGNTTNKNMTPPSSLIEGLKRLFMGVFSLICHMQLSARFPLTNCYNPAFIAAHPNKLWRYGYTWVALFADRLKYYFAWKVAEGASVLGGFGFQGYDKNGKVIGWSGVENIDVLGFELATNVQGLSRAWNKRTQGWLERYTYQRTGESLLATYFVSAIWHGLYPGFFLFFMSVPLVTNIQRLIKAKINPLIIPGYDNFNYNSAPQGIVTTLYWIVSFFCTTISVNYIVQVFSMSSWENCMIALGSFDHIGHIVIFAVYVVLELMPGPKKEKKAVKTVPGGGESKKSK